MFSEVLNGNSRRYNYREFVCDTLEDMYTINVSKVASGSKAVVIEGNKIYILSNSKEWKEWAAGSVDSQTIVDAVLSALPNGDEVSY